MSKQAKQEPMIEDLTVNQAQADAVKGGAIVDYYLKVDGIDGESTDIQSFPIMKKADK